MSEPSFDAGEVRQYYDGNTDAFLAFGQGGGIGAIHRAVWAPGVSTRACAFQYIEDRIATLLSTLSLDEPHVLDLGCGVGASLIYLAQRMPITGKGVTLSPIQVEIARRRVAAAGLAGRISCLESDYCQLPTSIGSVDLAFAIESFVHAADPRRFFAECGRVVRPGGLLVICDDFKGTDIGSPDAEETLRRFCAGWRVNTLIDMTMLDTLARAAGFEPCANTDLTPWLELGRPRDRFFRAVVPLLRWLKLSSVRLGNVLGGTALQRSLARGWVRYQLVVFQRR